MNKFKIKNVAVNVDGNWKLSPQMKLWSQSTNRTLSPSYVEHIKCFKDDWVECIQIKANNIEVYGRVVIITYLRGITQTDGFIPTVKINEVPVDVERESAFFRFRALLPEEISSCKSMLENQGEVSYIYLSTLDASEVTDMSHMFYGCYNLKDVLELETLDTSNVVSMQAMFSGCSRLTGLGLSTFDISSLTNADSMFQGCTSLAAVDLSGWHLSGVDITNMFNQCNALNSVKVSECDYDTIAQLLDALNTVKAAGATWIQDGEYLIHKPKYYIKLRLEDSRWPVVKINDEEVPVSKDSSVTYGYRAEIPDDVISCKDLIKNQLTVIDIDLSDLDTSDVTSMEWAFSSCYSLATIDLSTVDTSKVTTMESMFAYATSFESLDLSSFNTTSLVNTGSMFRGCSKLKYIDMSNWDMESVTNTDLMFGGCNVLESIKVANCSEDTVEVLLKLLNDNKIAGTRWRKDDDYLIPGYESIITLTTATEDYPNLQINGEAVVVERVPSETDIAWKASYVGQITNLANMCVYCSGQDKFLTIDVSDLDTTNVTTMEFMFEGCENITTVDLTSLDTSNVLSFDDMFGSCFNLEYLDFSSFNTSKATNLGRMFYGCRSLVSLDLSMFDTSKVEKIYAMFCDCEKLETLDLSNWDLRNLSSREDERSMFHMGQDSLRSIKVQNCDVNTVSFLIDRVNKVYCGGSNSWHKVGDYLIP